MPPVTVPGLRPFPSSVCSRGPCVPRASLAFPGAVGLRQRSRQATPVGGPRRPHCGPRDGGAGFLLPAPGARPPALLGAAEGPRRPPRGGRSAHAPSPTSSAWARALGRGRGAPRRRPTGTPCSPISPSSSSSSSSSRSNRTSLVIIAPPKAAPNLARSWGSRVPERRSCRGPGARVGTAGRVWLPAPGPLRPAQPALRDADPAADPNPAPKATPRH